ncbi:glycosyltransferase family 39 protein [Brevundimonas sp. BAL450]|uniref:ArnT family glycosyltransferase n=1 Tax=Brevundimonas sp. BAL450 TaxID=1708162 RepID=UPI0018C9AEAD|nr:glycosyltransferase family 39 protein [Brevundimonas sp. BAL450]MBG7615566.1 glycosyltransferase family 39 protein [Brevundimonas sp. BAL450]
MQRPDLDRLILGWRGPALAALIALIAGLPGLIMTPVLDRTEARTAQVSARMLERGDWIDTRADDQDRIRTAVGLHWFQAAATALTSDVQDRDIRPYRLPSLLGAMLAAWACAWGASVLFGARAGFLAGALLGGAFLMSTLAGVAQANALLAGLITLMMAALARLYVLAREGEAEASASGGPPPRLPRPLKLVVWGALGGAILVGGLTAPLVVGLALVTLGLMDRRWAWMRRLGWLSGLPLLALILGPWAIAATVSTDGEVWRHALNDNILARIIRGEADWGLPGRHLLLAPLLLFPLTLMLPAALETGLTRRAEPGVRFAVAWLVPAWLLFELAPDPMWHQTLPLYGAVTWLAAASLTRPLSRVSRWAGTALAVLGGVYVLGAALYALSEFGGEASQAWATPTIGLTLAAAAIGGFLLYHRMGVAAVLISLALGILAHASLAGLMRNLEPLWVSPRLKAAMIETGLHPVEGRLPGPVAVTGYSQPSVLFLFGSAARITDEAGAAAAIAAGRPAVVEARQDANFRAALNRLGAEARAEDRVEGVNYANGDRVELILYRPAPRPAPARRPTRPEVDPEPALLDPDAEPGTEDPTLLDPDATAADPATDTATPAEDPDTPVASPEPEPEPEPDQ